jgi:hypothetical protein
MPKGPLVLHLKLEPKLFWIGRGDAEPEAWEQTKALARQRHAGPVSRYLLGQPEVGEFLTDGLEKMLEYGVD